MTPKSLSLVYFSPTQTTKKILEGIAQGIEIPEIKTFDLTFPADKSHEFQKEDDLVIFGVPVYAGRMPEDAIKRIRDFKGNNTPAVLVVVYGNRAFEDALLEMKTLVAELGFNPFAGAAFIGEHSFSTSDKPIAPSRPDKKDLTLATEFGKSLKTKLDSLSDTTELQKIQVPGNVPYRDGIKASEAAPITREDDCVKCGTCAEVCPKEVVTVGDTVTTDALGCILCCACIKNCPTQARVMENPNILKTAQWLYDNCGPRKEPELFI